MNFKTTILLLVVLAAVGAAFYLLRDADPIGTEPPEGSKPAVINDKNFEADDIHRLAITSDGRTFVYERGNGGWKQTQPFEYEVSSWQPDTVANIIAGLGYTEKFTPGEEGQPSLTELKLDPPDVTIEATTKATDDAEARSYTVLVGRKAIGRRGYLKRADEPTVYVVDDLLHSNVEEDLKGWRVRTVKTPQESASNKVTLARRGQPDIEAEKIDGRWWFTGEHAGRVSSSALAAMLRQVSSSAVSEFIADQPEDLRDYKLDSPALKLSITTSDGKETKTLVVGSSAGFDAKLRYAAFLAEDGKVNTVFTLPDSALAIMQQPAEKFRDGKISTLRQPDVNRIELKRADLGDITLAAKAKGWAFETERDFQPDSKLIDQLAKSIVTAEAAAYRAAGEIDPDDAIATITLGSISQREPERITVAAKTSTEGGDRYLVLRNDEKIAYEVPVAELEAVFKSADELRDRNLWSVAVNEIKAIAIQRPDGMTYELMPAETATTANNWQLSVNGDTQAKFDQQAVSSLVLAIASFNVDQWRYDGESPNSDGIEVIVTPAQGEPKKATVWPNSKAGKVAGIDTHFRISESTATAINAELSEKTLISSGVDQITEIEITDVSSDSSVTLRRDGTGKFSGPDNFDEDATARLWDTISGLRAQRFHKTLPKRQPSRVIKITTTDQGIISLTLFGDKESTVGRLSNGDSGSSAFTLGDDASQSLHAAFTK